MERPVEELRKIVLSRLNRKGNAGIEQISSVEDIADTIKINLLGEIFDSSIIDGCEDLINKVSAEDLEEQLKFILKMNGFRSGHIHAVNFSYYNRMDAFKGLKELRSKVGD